MNYSYQTPLPITEITFHIDDSVEACYGNLWNRGYNRVDGDIRVGGKGKFVALGYKRALSTYDRYISNIIGVVSETTMPMTIYENGVEYFMVTDEFGNGDINKGSHGFYIYFYFTLSDRYLANPIKDLILQSNKNKLNNNNVETINNCSTSIKQGPLDINVGRGGSSPFNYILIIR